MAERRIVTALFCDVTGSTRLAGQLDDPEEWAEIINEAFPCLIRPVERYGGTVARLLGDAILAFFGAPVAHEDDPQRAILAGLEILEEIKPFSEKIQREYGFEFNVRVGINTGRVIVGDFGTQSAFEYTAMGDAVNIAARMQQTAQPGTVQVTHDTYWPARELFDFEPLGEIEVKGKDEPVRAFRVIGLATAGSRSRSTEFGAPAIVGRDRELRILRDSLAQTRSGRARIVTVVGEAGLGKSRLLAALREGSDQRRDDGPAPVWIEDHFSPFEASIPYSLLRKRIARGLGVTDRDTQETIGDRLARLPGFSSADSRERVVRAIDLLFHHSSARAASQDSDQMPTPFEGFRQELVRTVERLLREEVQRNVSAVYVIDDLHFLDPASIEMLGTLLPRLLDLPLLVLMGLRPDTLNPAWGLHRRLAGEYPQQYQTLTLAPLDDWQAAELVTELTKGASLSPDFRRSMLDRIDGNPLFAEEIVKSLIDRGLIVRHLEGDSPVWRLAPNLDLASITIPNTLQVLIQERMDRLGEDLRETLQVAAVVGRSFGHEELSAILNNPLELEQDLEALQRGMFIQLVPQADGREYSFNHALTREAVYETILRRRRPQLHLRVGEALERLHMLHAESDEEYAGLLGYHFAEANDPRAVKYATMAGDRALSLHAPADAAEQYSRAIDLARRLNIDLPTGILRRRGQAYETLGQFDFARRDIRAALEAARQAGDDREVWQAHMQLGLLWSGRDYMRSAEHLERALEIARNLEDPLLVAHSLNREGNVKINYGQLLEALDLHSEALQIFETSNDIPGIAESYDLLGMASWLSNDLAASTRYYERAIAVQREIDDRVGLASSLSMLSSRGGDLDNDSLDAGADAIEAGLQAGEEALAIARQIGWRAGEAFALLTLGKSTGARGEYRRAFELAQSSLAIAEEIEHLQWITAGRTLLGNLYVELLADDEACTHLELALTLAQQISSAWWHQRVASLYALALLQQQNVERALEVLDAAHPSSTTAKTLGQAQVVCSRIEIALAAGNPDEAAELLALVNCPGGSRHPRYVGLQARTQAALGNFAGAEAIFVPLIERMTIKRLRPQLWQMSVRLGQLYEATGRHIEATTRFNSARQTIEEILREIPDDSLRRVFSKQTGRYFPDVATSRTEKPDFQPG